MGAAAFTQKGEIPLPGGNRLLWGTLTMSSSYAANGDTIDMPGEVSLGDGSLQLSSSAGGYVLEYDGANAKVKAYWDRIQNAAAAALIEVTAATNLSAVSTECWALVTT